MWRAVVAASISAGLALTFLPGSASALPAATVSTNPVNWTPNVVSPDATVRQLIQCGSTMFAVGTFTAVAKPGGGKITRNNAFSFSATTGAISSWNPNVDGTVYSIAMSRDCAYAYLGGSFHHVHGVAVTYLAKVRVSTGVSGTPVGSFTPRPDNSLRGVAAVNGHLFVSGYFKSIGGANRSYFASVNANSGVISSYVNLAISGQVASTTSTMVYKLIPNPAGTRMLIIGPFTTVNGKTRMEAFVADLGSSSVTLDNWYAPGLTGGCASNFAWFVRSGNWSPSGSKIYLATTGVKGKSPYCDVIAQFSSASSSNIVSDWINKTGCDSLYAVAADTTSAYVGGHERYANNPNACDKAGPGSLPRPGVGAMSVSNGQANAWNPTRDRGHGADDMVRSSAGLWVASDTYYNSVKCGGEYHPGICFFPNT